MTDRRHPAPRVLTDEDVAAIVEAMESKSCSSLACRLTDDDVVFFKRFKSAIDTVAKGIGMAVILAIVSGLVWIGKLGVEAWRSGSGGH